MDDDQSVSIIVPPSVLDPRHVLVLHCPKCAFLTLSLNRLVEHCSLVHSRDACSVRLLQCGVCRLVCSNDDLLREHAATWHNLAAQGIAPAREFCFVRINMDKNAQGRKRRRRDPQDEVYHSCEGNTGSSSDVDSSCDRETKQLLAHHCLFCEFETAETDALREHYSAVHDVHNITARTAGSALCFSENRDVPSRNTLDESHSQPSSNILMESSSTSAVLYHSRDKAHDFGNNCLKVAEVEESREDTLLTNEEDLEDSFMQRNEEETAHVEKDDVEFNDVQRHRKSSLLLCDMKTDVEEENESLVYMPRDCIGGMQCHICGAHYPHRKGFTEHLRKKHQIYVSKEPLSLLSSSSSPAPTMPISASSAKSCTSDNSSSIVVQSSSSDLNKLNSGQVRCAYCRGWFAASYLHRHRRKMHPDRPPQTFGRSLRESVVLPHESTSSRGTAPANSFNVAASSQYRCPLVRCGRVCATAYSLKRHLKRAHKIKSPSGYGHLQQTIKLLKKEQQHLHQASEEGNCISDSNESNSLPNKNRLPSPLLQSPSTTPIVESTDLLRCPVCCAGFSHPSSLRRHQKLNSHDVPSSDDVDCQNNDSEDRIEEVTSDNATDDLNEGHFPCLLCSSNFRFEVDLRKHTGSAHAFADWRADDANSLGITCKCGLAIRSMHAFREHVLSQHLHQTLSCRWCTKEFPLLHALCSHAGQCAARPRSLYV